MEMYTRRSRSVDGKPWPDVHDQKDNDLSISFIAEHHQHEKKDSADHEEKENDEKPSKSYNVLFDYIPALVMSVLIALEVAYIASTFATTLDTDAIPYSIIDFVKVSWLITALLQFSTEMNWLLIIEYAIILLSNLDLFIYLRGKALHICISYICRNYSIIILSFPFFRSTINTRLPVTLLRAIFKALSTSAAFSICVIVFNGSSTTDSSSTAIYLVSTFSIIIFILQTALLAVANNRLSISLFVFHLGLLICVIINFILLKTAPRYDDGIGQLVVYLVQTFLIFVVVCMLVCCQTENHRLFKPLWIVLTGTNT